MIFEVLPNPGRNSMISAAVSGGGMITPSTKIEASCGGERCSYCKAVRSVTERKSGVLTKQESSRAAELPTGTAHISIESYFGFWGWEKQPGITSNPLPKAGLLQRGWGLFCFHPSTEIWR